MKSILNKIHFIDNILGEQTIDYNVKYRLLSYCKICEVFEKTFVLYNVLTKEMVLLDEDEYDELQKNEIQPNKKNIDFIKKWFLVPINNDDFCLSNGVSKTAKLIASSNYISDFTILTTTDCNARCFYCYELGRPRLPMSRENAYKAAQFIIDSSKNNHVSITWFGGEPLFNKEAIEIICKILRDNNIDFHSNFVSNGFLFDLDTIIYMKKYCNFRKVQISLDGTEETYNKSKAYIYKNVSPYRIVLENIDNLLKHDIKVVVRLNIDEYNHSDIRKLCEVLYEKFGKYKCFGVYTALLMKYENNKIVSRNYKESINLLSKYIDINDYLYEKNINNRIVLRKKTKYSRCMADSKHSAVITPIGGIGKCEHFSDNDFWRTLDNPRINNDIIEEWNNCRLIFDKCYSCVHYPECIKLKKCPDDPEDCSELDVIIKDYHLMKSIEIVAKKKFGEIDGKN